MTAVDVGSTGSAEFQDLSSMLFSAPRPVLGVPPFAWGFGGLHGGLALALVAASIQGRVPRHSLRSITGQFHRPIRDTFAVTSLVIRSGRSVAGAQATGRGPAGVCLTATAILGSDQEPAGPVYTPDAPDVPGPELLSALDRMDEVPVLSQVDVRPVGAVRPYAGTSDPTMTAWMRVKGVEAPADPCSVIFFLDALPPSYTAVLSQPRPVPTLELSAHLTSHVPTSPWVLVRSRTVRADGGGWVTESIDAWDIDGAHLGSARQLRLAATASDRPHDQSRNNA